MVTEREVGVSTESHTQDPGVEIVNPGSMEKGEPKAKRRSTSKLEMDSNTRELFLNNRDLSANAHCRMVRHGHEVIKRWRGELGFETNPEGHPRKKLPSDLIEDLYSKKGLSTPVLAGMFECSVGTIIDRLRSRGCEIRPRGPYYKQK